MSTHEDQLLYMDESALAAAINKKKSTPIQCEGILKAAITFSSMKFR